MVFVQLLPALSAHSFEVYVLSSELEAFSFNSLDAVKTNPASSKPER